MNTTQNKRKRKSANVGNSSMHDIFENTEPTTECVLLKKVLLKISQNLQEYTCTLYQGLFFTKVAGLKSAILLKKRLRRGCFPANFTKFLKIPFLQNTSGRLFLKQLQKEDLRDFRVINTLSVGSIKIKGFLFFAVYSAAFAISNVALIQ